jgi:hypothetical protein
MVNDFGNENDGIAQKRKGNSKNERINFDESEHISPDPFCRMNNFDGRQRQGWYPATHPDIGIYRQWSPIYSPMQTGRLSGSRIILLTAPSQAEYALQILYY